MASARRTNAAAAEKGGGGLMLGAACVAAGALAGRLLKGGAKQEGVGDDVQALLDKGAARKATGPKTARGPLNVEDLRALLDESLPPVRRMPPGMMAAASAGAATGGQGAPPGGAEAAATKKDLEAAVRAMGGSLGGPDDDVPALERFTTDLTDEARKGQLDPLVGRDNELRRVIHVLSRRTKNNPVLLGEAGVGKTAIVEGLAQRIAAGDVPVSLRGLRVMELDISALSAGCQVPGDFEERLTGLIAEVVEAKPPIILFIDDLHNLVPTGPNAGQNDGGAVLKPALGRGQLRCIGASMPDKFKKTVEQDAALERRFQQVVVEEPTHPHAISILRGLRPRYEGHHGVGVSEEALVAAVGLGARYVTGRKLPDKAIDLIDEACAQVKMELTLKPEALDIVDRRVAQLETERKQVVQKARGSGGKDRVTANVLEEITTELAEQRTKQKTLREAAEGERANKQAIMRLRGDVARATYELNAATKRGADSDTIDSLKKKETELQEQLTLRTKAESGRNREVSEQDVAQVVSRWTGVPASKLVASEAQKLLQLQDELHRRIIGQEEAVTAVAEAIQRSRADLSDPNAPVASFMFLGPTGVGKTELAKALANYMFNSDAAMIRLDMSEYMEKHSVARLIGAPPGYVGYEEGGLLTDQVKRRPYSVVLFDEIEKAHVDVFNILLQVLDEGRVTDTQGATISFRNTVIILTSNLGSNEVQKLMNPDYVDEEAEAAVADAAKKSDESGEEAEAKKKQGDSTALKGKDATGDESELPLEVRIKSKVMGHVRAHFRPEFINRIDEFIIFEPLKQDQIRRIVQLQVKAVANRIEEKRMRLEMKESAIDYLAAKGYDPQFGARPVKRAIQRDLLQMLALAMLRGDFGEDDRVIVEAQFGKLTCYKGEKVSRKQLKLDEEEATDGLAKPSGPMMLVDPLMSALHAGRGLASMRPFGGAKPAAPAAAPTPAKAEGGGNDVSDDDEDLDGFL